MADSSELRGRIIDRLRGARRILVTSHEGIDGDSAGSAIALMTALRRWGKEACYRNAEPLPSSLDFVPGFSMLAEPFDETKPFDLGVILDTSYAARIGSVWKLMESIPRIVIDHHESDGSAADLCWCDQSAASVTVMIGELLEQAGMALDFELALPIYVGIFTDTMSFQQSNADPRAIMWGARCVAAGVKPYEVSVAILENKTLAAVRLGGRAAARLEREGGLVHASLTQEDFRETGAGDADTEGIIQTLRTVGGIRVAALFRELADGRIKLTMRSKDGTNVAAVARHFGGGGHVAAAGCTVPGPMERARADVLAYMRAELEKGK